MQSFNAPLASRLSMSDLTNNDEITAYVNKINYYLIKEKELWNIILATYTIDNIPKQLKQFGGERFILKSLFGYGCCIFTDNTNIGFVASPPKSPMYNVFDDIARTGLEICNFNTNIVDDIIKINGNKSYLDKDEFVPVYVNKIQSGYFIDIQHRANTYAKIEQLLDNNIVVKSLMLILEGKENQAMAFDELIDIIHNQNGIAKIDVASGLRSDEFLKVIVNEIETIFDKCVELNKNKDSEFLAKIGINHIPYEKKERLTNDEIATNNQLIDVVRDGIINTVNEGLERVNEKYGTNMKMRLTVAKESEGKTYELAEE